MLCRKNHAVTVFGLSCSEGEGVKKNLAGAEYAAVLVGLLLVSALYLWFSVKLSISIQIMLVSIQMLVLVSD